jgi:phosphoribosylanthranilate isomerase
MWRPPSARAQPTLASCSFAKSPRNVTLDEAARLAAVVPPGVAKVALTVDADDAMLDALLAAVPIDMLQLHGHEAPTACARCARGSGCRS